MNLLRLIASALLYTALFASTCFASAGSSEDPLESFPGIHTYNFPNGARLEYRFDLKHDMPTEIAHKRDQLIFIKPGGEKGFENMHGDVYGIIDALTLPTALEITDPKELPKNRDYFAGSLAGHSRLTLSVRYKEEAIVVSISNVVPNTGDNFLITQDGNIFHIPEDSKFSISQRKAFEAHWKIITRIASDGQKFFLILPFWFNGSDHDRRANKVLVVRDSDKAYTVTHIDLERDLILEDATITSETDYVAIFDGQGKRFPGTQNLAVTDFKAFEWESFHRGPELGFDIAPPLPRLSGNNTRKSLPESVTPTANLSRAQQVSEILNFMQELNTPKGHLESHRLRIYGLISQMNAHMALEADVLRQLVTHIMADLMGLQGKEFYLEPFLPGAGKSDHDSHTDLSIFANGLLMAMRESYNSKNPARNMNELLRSVAQSQVFSERLVDFIKTGMEKLVLKTAMHTEAGYEVARKLAITAGETEPSEDLIKVLFNVQETLARRGRTLAQPHATQIELEISVSLSFLLGDLADGSKDHTPYVLQALADRGADLALIKRAASMFPNDRGVQIRSARALVNLLGRDKRDSNQYLVLRELGKIYVKEPLDSPLRAKILEVLSGKATHIVSETNPGFLARTFTQEVCDLLMVKITPPKTK